MRGFVIVVLVLFNLVCHVLSNIYNNVVSPPSLCFKAYDGGGASAVFHSPECRQWLLGSKTLQNKNQNCDSATLQGHRDYQEDRVACNLDMRLPFRLGEDGTGEVTLSIALIFDGHGASEVSELASVKFLDYFQVNAILNAYQHAFHLNQETEEADRHSSTLEISLVKLDDKSLHDILEEALRRTFKDIDSEFSVEAANKKSVAGSTGIVIILLNEELLIGYVGDSRALLCRRGNQSHHQELYAELLTVDHHPDRKDEKARIEKAGGFVRVWGVPRVNGILAVSRALGDVYLKKHGLIAVPEIISWRNVTDQDSYLVIASDGIFEGMTPQDVCDLMANTDIHGKVASKTMVSCSSSSSLADCIVNAAFRSGSTDNLSSIVILLRPDSSWQQQDEENSDKSEL